MLELTARKAARHDEVLQAEVTVGAQGKGVGRVVTVLVAQQATKAEVKVLAVQATHKVGLIHLCISLLALVLRISQGNKATYHGSTRCT